MPLSLYLRPSSKQLFSLHIMNIALIYMYEYMEERRAVELKSLSSRDSYVNWAVDPTAAYSFWANRYLIWLWLFTERLGRPSSEPRRPLYVLQSWSSLCTLFASWQVLSPVWWCLIIGRLREPNIWTRENILRTGVLVPLLCAVGCHRLTLSSILSRCEWL
jgi:hypothetical protein